MKTGIGNQKRFEAVEDDGEQESSGKRYERDRPVNDVTAAGRPLRWGRRLGSAWAACRPLLFRSGFDFGDFEIFERRQIDFIYGLARHTTPVLLGQGFCRRLA